jgi:predicted kinase
MPTVYLLIGVPGSGKSTWLSKQDLSNAVVLSTDNYVEHFAKLNNKTYTEIFKSVIGEATRLMHEDLRQAIRDRKDIYWDQTNLTAKTRAGKLAQIPGTYEKVAVYFPTPSDAELARRLAARPGKTIPANVVLGMKSQLEPPTLAEGFDDITVVSS